MIGVASETRAVPVSAAVTSTLLLMLTPGDYDVIVSSLYNNDI